MISRPALSSKQSKCCAGRTIRFRCGASCWTCGAWLLPQLRTALVGRGSASRGPRWWQQRLCATVSSFFSGSAWLGARVAAQSDSGGDFSRMKAVIWNTPWVARSSRSSFKSMGSKRQDLFHFEFNTPSSNTWMFPTRTTCCGPALRRLGWASSNSLLLFFAWTSPRSILPGCDCSEADMAVTGTWIFTRVQKQS